MAATVSGRRRTRAALAIVSLLGFLAAFVGWAPPALAHHPEISGSVDCGVPDGYLVSFLSQSWQQSGGDNGGGANPDIAVLYRLRTDGGAPGAWTELPADPTYRYNQANGYEFGDDVLLPDTSAGNEVQLRARADANWGNGQPGGQTTDSEWIDFPTDCDEPGVPDASVEVACVEGDGVVSATLANTGGDLAVTFTVSVPGQPAQDVTVAPGASDEVSFSGLADGSVTVTITAGGQDLSKTVEVACDRPGVPDASVEVACVEGDGVVSATLANTGGDLAVTFTVSVPGQPAQDVTVAPGASDEVSFSGLADGSVTVTITAGGQDLSQTVNVDCDRPGVPEVGNAASCSAFDGVVTVQLSNTGGDLPVTFVVVDPRTDETVEVTLDPGASEDVVLDGFEDGPWTIEVRSGDVRFDQSVEIDCDRPGTPEVSTSVDCIAEGGLVTVVVSNVSPAGEAEPITFVVSDPSGGEPETVTVAAGEAVPVTFGGLVDGTYTIDLTADGASVPSIEVTVDCEQPTVLANSLECVEGGYLIELGNDGGTPSEITVSLDGVVVETVEVTDDEPVAVLVPMVEDQTGVVTVVHDGVVLVDVEVTRDCQNPAVVNTDVVCAEGGFTVTVENDGAIPATVVALLGDVEVDQADVPAGGAVDLFVGFEEDETEIITVTHDGEVLLDVEVTFDCHLPPGEPPATPLSVQPSNPPGEPSPSVLGVSLTPDEPAQVLGEQLPVTGGTLRVAFLGVSLLALGGLMVSVARGGRRYAS